MSKTAAVICAGGTGRRMGTKVPKQFIELDDGTSIIRKSVDAFREYSPDGGFDAVVVTAPAGYIEKMEAVVNPGQAGSDHGSPEEDAACSMNKAAVIEGGSERQDSVWNALRFLKEKGFESDDIVLIHDGARPFVTADIISGVISAAHDSGAAIAAVPVKDTIRDIKKGTLDRSGLYQVQTPQGFRFGLIYDAVEKAIQDGFYGTDDGSLAEREGVLPAIVQGSYSNIKITTLEDL